MQSPSPFVRSFQQAEPYEQDEPGIAEFHWLLKKDEVPGLQMGLVELKGPIHKTPAAHATFHQAYLIQFGCGTIYLGDQVQPINGPAVVVIPANTWHSVKVAAGEELTYVFVNQHHLAGPGEPVTSTAPTSSVLK